MVDFHLNRITLFQPDYYSFSRLCEWSLSKYRVLSLTLPQWLTMSHNLIYLGLHFTISKCQYTSDMCEHISNLRYFFSIRQFFPCNVSRSQLLQTINVY